MVVFTEKRNTKGVADLEGKLQKSVLDMLFEVISGYLLGSCLQVRSMLKLYIRKLLS